MARMGSVEIPIDADTKSFEKQIETVEKELEDLLRIYEKSKKSKFANEEDLQKQELEIEKLKNKLAGLRAQQEKLDYGDSSKQLIKHDKSLSNIIKKVGKWALAVFGVRSAYQFVRQAASTIGQYDKKIGADIQYIRYALAFTLKPVIEWLIKAAYTILQYIGAIVKQLTGKNIFANSGASQFQKSMKSSEKSSKKIKDNITASFDEINKVSKSDSGVSGDEGSVGPSVDLSKGIEDIKLPKWLEKTINFIKDNKKEVLMVVGGLLTLLTFGKAIKWLSPLGSFFGSLGGVAGQLGVIAGSIAVIGVSAYEWYKGNIKQKETLNKLNEQGVEYSKEDAQNFKDIYEMEDGIKYRRKKGTELLRKSYTLSALVTGTQNELVDGVKSSVEQQDNYLQEQIKNYRQGKLTKEEQDKLKNVLYEQIGYLVDIGDEMDYIGEDSEFIHTYTQKYRDILYEMGEPQGPLSKMNDWWDKIYGRTTENVGNAIADMAKLAGMKLPDKEMKVNVKADTSSASSTLSQLAVSFAKVIANPLKNFGFTSMADNIINKAKNFKLASGAIINQPGRGVPVGAIAGESGREGILPLTDSRAMAELGQEIGKYVNINNVINNYVDGRRLNQIMAKSQNRDSFAGNR